jgi:hypothetical protein
MHLRPAKMWAETGGRNWPQVEEDPWERCSLRTFMARGSAATAGVSSARQAEETKEAGSLATDTGVVEQHSSCRGYVTGVRDTHGGPCICRARQAGMEGECRVVAGVRGRAGRSRWSQKGSRAGALTAAQ